MFGRNFSYLYHGLDFGGSTNYKNDDRLADLQENPHNKKCSSTIAHTATGKGKKDEVDS